MALAKRNTTQRLRTRNQVEYVFAIDHRSIQSHQHQSPIGRSRSRSRSASARHLFRSISAESTRRSKMPGSYDFSEK